MVSSESCPFLCVLRASVVEMKCMDTAQDDGAVCNLWISECEICARLSMKVCFVCDAFWASRVSNRPAEIPPGADSADALQLARGARSLHLSAVPPPCVKL
jgi:hypothetical protein